LLGIQLEEVAEMIRGPLIIVATSFGIAGTAQAAGDAAAGKIKAEMVEM
jgi:hypothetical protein